MNHLLIVDDNPVDRELARQLVEKHTRINAEFACNGIEAIEHLEAAVPLVILTDLHMPEMDGLALVRTVRQKFPTIPVVLMTAHGSEEIALEALAEGAADYVPKHRLASDLPRILESVIGAASGVHRHEEVTHRLLFKHLRYSIEHDVNFIPPLVDQLQQAAANLSLIEQADRVRLARSLAEAVHNAVVHGKADTSSNAEPPRVSIIAEFTQTEARFVIRDQGRGFDPAAVVDPRVNPSHLTADSGRGLALIRLFMDEVFFNDSGNEITLVKRKSNKAGVEQAP